MNTTSPPDPTRPWPVRNDVPRAGRELLVLRHHGLRAGGHEAFYRFSRDEYWPYFERLGARVVGQWKVVAPAGAVAPDTDDVYRLVRYASFEHWEATRKDRAFARLGGNGPEWARGQQALADRAGLQTGTRGAHFLEGCTYDNPPLHMPALDERYEPAAEDEALAPDAPVPVRVDGARPGDEVVALVTRRIAKGGFDEVRAATLEGDWPWAARLGARPIGTWRVVHPGAPTMTPASAEHDEVVSMVRYASRAHFDAMHGEGALRLGGDGPDWHAHLAARRAVERLTRAVTVELVQGFLYASPPTHLPTLDERYRRIG